jgi:hypothetical protein
MTHAKIATQFSGRCFSKPENSVCNTSQRDFPGHQSQYGVYPGTMASMASPTQLLTAAAIVWNYRGRELWNSLTHDQHH